MHPVQEKILREMTPSRRLEIAMGMQRSARAIKAAALRQKHPEWSEEEVLRELARLTLYGAI